MKRILIFCIFILSVCGCSKVENNIDKKDNNEHMVIDCNKKDELMENGAILIDVRTEEEYSESNLPNSINIPVDEIIDGMIKNDFSKDQLIIVYCRSGARSISAYRELKNNGYTNVYDLGPMSKCEY